MLPEGVARHWKQKRFSVFLLNLMSFPILMVRLIFISTNVNVLFVTSKHFAENLLIVRRINKREAPCGMFRTGLRGIIFSGRSSLLGLGNDSLERFRMIHREVGEHLTVNLDAGLCEGAHQLRV